MLDAHKKYGGMGTILVVKVSPELASEFGELVADPTNSCITQRNLKLLCIYCHRGCFFSAERKSKPKTCLTLRQGFMEEFNDISSTCQGDIFKSPCLKTAPSAFVAKRSKYSTIPDNSPPLPDAFSNVADEDMWFKMNNGYVADLDSLQTTPTRKVQSLPAS